jgi:hypothetical protein
MKKILVIIYLVIFHVLFFVVLVQTHFGSRLVDKFYGSAQHMPEALRARKYGSRSAKEAVAWQNSLRAELAELMNEKQLISRVKNSQEFKARVEVVKQVEKKVTEQEQTVVSGYTMKKIILNLEPGKQSEFLMTFPIQDAVSYPVVILIPGHGDTVYTPYESAKDYYNVGELLAESGFVTVSVFVGYHENSKNHSTLTGERLFELISILDYVSVHDKVDSERIGCMGYSLGGGMAMWLGAMDTRIKSVVTAGFLTTMRHLTINKDVHCECWNFPGLGDLVEFADIYSLIAPRSLLCQTGIKEPEDRFNVKIAKEAFAEIKNIYQDLGKPENLELVVHSGGHSVNPKTCIAFFKKNL